MCRVWLTVRRVTLGSYDAMGPDCIALLWELSNYRIGLGARFAFCCDFSRVELGHSDCSVAPRMGPEEQLVGGAAEQSECWGFKVLQFVFGDVLPRGMRSAVRFDRPTCYPCPALAWRGSHYALYEHGRGKRAHPIYQRVLAQGRSRARAAYQSCLFLKEILFWRKGRGS
jgi:hypothetical protein